MWERMACSVGACSHACATEGSWCWMVRVDIKETAATTRSTDEASTWANKDWLVWRGMGVAEAGYTHRAEREAAWEPCGCGRQEKNSAFIWNNPKPTAKVRVVCVDAALELPAVLKRACRAADV